MRNVRLLASAVVAILILGGCSWKPPVLVSPVPDEVVPVPRPRVEWWEIKNSRGIMVQFQSETGETRSWSVSPDQNFLIVPEDLVPGNWSVRIRSRYAIFSGPWSKTVSFVLRPGTPEFVSPESSARFRSGEAVPFLWTRVEGEQVSYTLEWGQTDLAGVYHPEGQISALSEPTAVVENLPPGEWRFRVRADTTWGGTSLVSSERSVIIEEILPWVYTPQEGDRPDSEVVFFQSAPENSRRALGNFAEREQQYVRKLGTWVSGYRYNEQAYSLHADRTGDWQPVWLLIDPAGKVLNLVPPAPYESYLEAPGAAYGSWCVLSATDGGGRSALVFYHLEGDELVSGGLLYPQDTRQKDITLTQFAEGVKTGLFGLPDEYARAGLWCTTLLVTGRADGQEGETLVAAGILTPDIPFGAADPSGREIPDERLAEKGYIPWMAVLEWNGYDLSVKAVTLNDKYDPRTSEVPLQVWYVPEGEYKFSMTVRTGNPLLPDTWVIGSRWLYGDYENTRIKDLVVWKKGWGAPRMTGLPGEENLLWSGQHLALGIKGSKPQVQRIGITTLRENDQITGYRFEEAAALNSGAFVLMGMVSLETDHGPEQVPVAVRVTSAGAIRFFEPEHGERFAITLERP